jgi:pimeloyl-ACP methyl ester carboxylesterase
MKKQVFYIHGGSSYSNYDSYLEDLRLEPIRDLPGLEPQKKWTDSLRETLCEYDVFKPGMPNSKNAKYEEWKIWFERYIPHLKDGLVCVGWSQGGYFFAKYLIENPAPVRIKALFLIAAPFQPDNFGGEDGGDFAFDTGRVGELAKKAEKIYIFHSKDDFVVPYDHAIKYKEALPEAELVSFEDKNHFLVPEFPELINKIRSI